MLSKNPTKTYYSKTPFELVVFDDLFEPTFVSDLQNLFNNILSLGLSEGEDWRRFWRSKLKRPSDENFYDTYNWTFPAELPSPLTFFLSSSFKRFIEDSIYSEICDEFYGCFLHHPKGCRDSFIHSDFTVNNLTTKGTRPEGGFRNHDHRLPYMGTHPEAQTQTRRFRSYTAIFYFNNSSQLVDQDEGRVCFYREPYQESLFQSFSPLNNRLVIFEVTPTSFHRALGNPSADRNGLALFFHSSIEKTIRRFPDVYIN